MSRPSAPRGYAIQPPRVTTPPAAEILDAVRRGQRYDELAVIYGVSASTLRRRVTDSGLVAKRRHGSLPALSVRTEEPTWMEQAVCAQTDPESWFPEKGGSTREAKGMCRRCDVTDKCLAYALEHDERFGVWGGKSETERKQMRRAAKP